MREGVHCRSAWFIERGMTRSYRLVDGEQITASLSTGGGHRLQHGRALLRPSEHRTRHDRPALPARGRYPAMRQQLPGVCERARLGEIASYPGVTASTLSGIRAEAARRRFFCAATADCCREKRIFVNSNDPT